MLCNIPQGERLERGRFFWGGGEGGAHCTQSAWDPPTWSHRLPPSSVPYSWPSISRTPCAQQQN